MQEGIRGGNWEHGLLMGAVSGAGGAFLTHHGRSLGKGGMIVANAVLSGTVSEIGGGKFANGAITGAFAVMFNDLMHPRKEKKALQQMKREIEKDGILTFKEARKWYREGDGSAITVDADKINLNFLDVNELIIGKGVSVQTWRGGIAQGLVHGGITIVYKGNNQVEIQSDTYEFRMHPWSSFIEVVRNIETLIAIPIHGRGIPFPIIFRGLNTIHYKPPTPTLNRGEWSIYSWGRNR